MYVIKHLPDDFIVEERSKIQPGTAGAYTYFLLEKRQVTTPDAIRKLAFASKLPTKMFGYAGNKDKQAVTMQMCSVKRVPRLPIKLNNMKVTVLGRGRDPISLGDLEGNTFTITVRNINLLPGIKTKFLNLFGVQRFGRNNVDVGRAIVKRKFEDAAVIVDDPIVQSFYDKTKEALGALRKLDNRILMLYVHAYQSWLWNKAAVEMAKRYPDAGELPIVGFGTEITNEVVKVILDEEAITPRDFVIHELPVCSVEGGMRNMYEEAQELQLGELEEDECFPGKKKVTLSFFLSKGVYATEFIRQNFSTSQ